MQNSPWTVQTTPGIYSLCPNLLEPKSRPSRPQQIVIHYMTLKQKVKQVGENPLPFWSLSKLTETGTHVQSLSWGATLLLASSELVGPIAGNSREKVELLSLKIHIFPLFLYLSFSVGLPLSSFPSQTRLVKIGTREKSSQCHMSNFCWLRGLHLILLSNHYEISL